MKTVNVIIDKKPIQVPEHYTVLEAAKQEGIWIPTLCYLKGVNEIGACRICLIEVKGAKALQAACSYPVREGMEIYTNTPAVREARRVNLELILSNHDRECLTCIRNGCCELQTLAIEFNIKKIRFVGSEKKAKTDYKSDSIVRNPNKCVLCRRCVGMCKDIQTVAAIGVTNRGFGTEVEPAFQKSIADVDCVNCGQCIMSCPVGAIHTKDDTERVWNALANPKMHVVVQTAPAVRVAIGEEFGMPIGSRVTANMVGSLKRLGFDRVFDTDTGADLTIMEEGTELIERLKKGENLPLITSCSPGWIKFCEHFYPEFLPNLSTCKSPQQMFGAILKTYYAEKENLDPANIFVVAVMPCTAKKFEANRPEMMGSGYMDVDAVITTRGLAKMIKEAAIDFEEIHDGEYDQPMGDASGAGVIFGSTGGVMEAALRTVSEVLSGEPSPVIEYEGLRGVAGIKEASIEAGGIKIKGVVASGLGNARIILDRIKSGEAQYDFVEIMACPGGCITGGGQPIQPSYVTNWIDIKKERGKQLYKEDRKSEIRKSHENPVIQEIYDNFLGKPGGHKAHALLHTSYINRSEA